MNPMKPRQIETQPKGSLYIKDNKYISLSFLLI